MTLARWTAALILATTLHLQAQSPTPAPTPAQTTAPAQSSGPTLDETFAFINKVFTEQGQLHFRQRFYSSRLSDYVDWTETAIEAQSLQVVVAPCTVKAHFFSVSLGSIDPRAIHIITYAETQDTDSFSIEQGLKYSTDPEVYILTFGTPDKAEKQLGTFLDKSLAERVAKAYIHASVLCGAKADPF